MRSSVPLLALLAGGLILAGGTAAAEHEGSSPIQVFVKAADHPSGLVKLARRFEVVDGPAPGMPVPIEPAPVLGRDALSGPAAMSDGDLSTGISSVLLAPRGAAFSSPRQIADREIRKLIRRLD